MRSTPSLDRGRSLLPRGLFAAAAAGATLVAAVLAIGWLAGGLVTGTWAPRSQVASVSGDAVTLPEATAPRPKPARVPARRPHVEPRARVVRAEAAPRPRPRRVRRRPAAAKQPAVAPAPTPAAAPASAVSHVSSSSPPATSAQPKPEPTRWKPKKETTQLSQTSAPRSSTGADVKPPPGSRGKGHGRGHGSPPAATPAPPVGYGQDKHADKDNRSHSDR